MRPRTRNKQGFSLANPVHFLALGFGSGLAPVAPGTFGTLAAVPLYLLASGLPLSAYLGIVLIGSGLGVWLCERTTRDLAVHDHPAIVWDEIMGYLVTMIAAPPGWIWIGVGFLLFRLFDVWKPWPIGYLDRHLRGGLGIMVDDLVAGVLALLILQAMARWTGGISG